MLPFLMRHTGPLLRLVIIFACLLPFPGAVCAQEPGIRFSTEKERSSQTVSRLLEEGKELRKTDADSALSLFRKALKLGLERNDHYVIADALLHSGLCLLDQRKNRESLVVLKQAVPYSHRASLEDPVIRPKLCNAVGAAYIRQGYSDSALHYLFRALTEYRTREVKDLSLLGGIYANIAAVMTGGMRLPDQSFHYTDKAIPIALHVRDTGLLTVLYANLSTAWKIKGVEDSSLYYARRCLQLYLAQGRLKEAQDQYCDIGGIWLQHADYRKAATYLDSAVRIFPGGVKDNQVLQLRLGRISRQQGDYKEAIRHFRNALAINIRQGTNQLAMSVYENLAEVYHVTGQYRAAYEAKSASQSLMARLFREDMLRSAHELEVKYRMLEKNQELTRRQLQLTRQQAQLKQKNIWIGVTVGGSLLIILAVVAVFLARRSLQREKVRNAERGRIAGDLHDGMGALLSAIKMNYTLLGKQHQLAGTETFRDGMALINEMRDEMRAIALNLMPESIARKNLADAVHVLCNRMQGADIRIDVQTYGDFTLLHNDLYFAVYRMTEEMINNSIKHSGATRLLVQLMMYEDRLHVTVEDNGKGFDPTHIAEDTGMGLGNLRARAEKLKGSVRVSAQPGMGVCIELEVPYSA